MHFFLSVISTGHVLKGMRDIRLTIISIRAEIIKIDNLYFSSNEKNGICTSTELKIAPMPTRENIIGKVQQNNVLIDVIKANHVRLIPSVFFIYIKILSKKYLYNYELIFYFNQE